MVFLGKKEKVQSEKDIIRDFLTYATDILNQAIQFPFKSLKNLLFQSGDQIAVSILKFKEKIDTIREIKNDFIHSLSHISSATKDLSGHAQELDATMLQFKEKLSLASQLTKQTKSLSETILKNNTNSRENIEKSFDTSQAILEQNQKQIQELKSLMNSIKKVKESVKLVRDISEQTNLLSLNASIEAARAGEEGRGFSVVADGVSKLAEKSKTTVKQIDAAVDTIIQELTKWSEDSQTKLEKFNFILNSLNSIKSNLELNYNNAKDSSEKMNQLEDIHSKFSKMVDEIQKNSEIVSTSTMEISHVIDSLHEQGNNLNQILDNMIEDTQKSIEQITNQNAVWLLHFMQARRIDHINWVRKVRDCIDKKTTEGFPEIRHTHCNMGRWYYQCVVTDEEQEFIHKKLEIPHLNLHKVGARIYDNIKEKHYSRLEKDWQELNQYYTEIAMIFDEYHEFLLRKSKEIIESKN